MSISIFLVHSTILILILSFSMFHQIFKLFCTREKRKFFNLCKWRNEGRKYLKFQKKRVVEYSNHFFGYSRTENLISKKNVSILLNTVDRIFLDDINTFVIPTVRSVSPKNVDEIYDRNEKKSKKSRPIPKKLDFQCDSDFINFC